MLFSPVTVIYKISILRENLSGAVTCKWGVSSSTWACRGRWRSRRRRGPHTWACASCPECPSPASPSPPARGTSAFLGVCQQQDHRPFFSQMLWYLLQGCSSVPGIANGILKNKNSTEWFKRSNCHEIVHELVSNPSRTCKGALSNYRKGMVFKGRKGAEIYTVNIDLVQDWSGINSFA